MNTRGRLHPAAIEFGRVECCALKSAMASGVDDQFIKTAIAEAQRTAPDYQWKILIEVFIRTERMTFIPYPVRRGFYLNLALKEKAHVKDILLQSEDVHGTPYFLCGHSLAEHIVALDNIVSVLATAGRNN